MVGGRQEMAGTAETDASRTSPEYLCRSFELVIVIRVAT